MGVIDRPGGASALTGTTRVEVRVFEEVHARRTIDNRDLRNGLLVGDVDRRPRYQSCVVGGSDNPCRACRDLLEIDRARRADGGACAAGHADRRVLVVRRRDFAGVPTSLEVDRARMHEHRTYPRTKTAENAVLVLLGEAGLGHADLLRGALIVDRVTDEEDGSEAPFHQAPQECFLVPPLCFQEEAGQVLKVKLKLLKCTMNNYKKHQQEIMLVLISEALVKKILQEEM